MDKKAVIIAVSSIALAITLVTAIFVPVSSEEIYCVAEDRDYHLLRGELDDYNSARNAAPELEINDGGCIPKQARLFVF